MRKVIVVMVFVFLLISGGASFAFQNEPDGFRGLKWGDPPTEDMKYFDTIEGNKSYVLFEEKNSFGDVELEQIFYVFYGDPGRFVSVMLSFKGKLTFERLEAFCRQEYGEENAEGFDGSSYWEGEDAIVGFDYDPEQEEGSLIAFSVSILTEMMTTEMDKEFAEFEEGE